MSTSTCVNGLHFFDKKSRDTTTHTGTETVTKNQRLTNRLHKLSRLQILMENLKEAKYTHVFEITFGVLILQICNNNEFNKGVRFVIDVIDIYSKYDWDAPLKDFKVLQSLMHFKKFWMSLVVNLTKYG